MHGSGPRMAGEPWSQNRPEYHEHRLWQWQGQKLKKVASGRGGAGQLWPGRRRCQAVATAGAARSTRGVHSWCSAALPNGRAFTSAGRYTVQTASPLQWEDRGRS